MRSVHSARLERWLGTAKVNELSRQMRGWYGPPIHLLDVPGSVRVCGDGDFIGPFERGYFASAADSLRDSLKAALRVRPVYGQFGAGFADVADYLVRAATGHRQVMPFFKQDNNFVVNAAFSAWAYTAGSPVAGSPGSAAPGGRAPDNTTTGAFNLVNPASGTMHLTGADVTDSCNGFTSSLLLYDRIFDVAKTMNTVATEAVTGVPTRYQSATVTDSEYAGGNFLFAEATTNLAATAHNWTECQYTDQDGNVGAVLPSFAGVSACAAERIDSNVTMKWFMPLASGDTGIKALTQMQCDALVATGAITFTIGHPIGFISGLVKNILAPFDWITNRNQGPRIINSACLALLVPAAGGNGNPAFGGSIEVTTAAA